MVAPETRPFPVVGLQVVTNAQREWTAVALQLAPDAAHAPCLHALFGACDALAALAPLDCIVPLDPRALSDELLQLLPPQRVLFSIPAALCAEPQVQQQCARLTAARYRIVVDGVPALNAAPAGARALSVDCSQAMPGPGHWQALPGPHLARQVRSAPHLEQCKAAGFDWFAGRYLFDAAKKNAACDDVGARQRLLALLGLLARDADSRELEVLLKQDPVLSYHLLKLVNSAAFAPSVQVHSFGQAINLLGRRQLQRWLQLLLYARQAEGGAANSLLPLAALRGAQMEALCKLNGGDRDRQDSAFVAGVFSLLDLLLGMPMADIVGALSLEPAIGAALLERSGPLGPLLTLTEAATVDAAALGEAGVDAAGYWNSLLQAYQWAILVGRGL